MLRIITILGLTLSYLLSHGLDVIAARSHRKKKVKSLSAYGKFGIMAYTQKSDLSLENLGSRIGLNANRIYPSTRFKVYAKGEWSFNAIDNTADLSIGADNRIVSDSNDSGTFRRRLGYIGFQLNSYGDIRLGKQWSVYTDIAHFTDRFNIFGGAAGGTYNLNTDGGQSGTGRASKALTYRNKIGSFKYGLQAKLIQNRELSIGSTPTSLIAQDAYGFSFKNIFSNNVEIGMAYNKIELRGNTNIVPGYSGGDSWSAVFGIKIPTKNWLLSFIYNQSKDHELDDNEEVFDGQGFETYISYKINEPVKIYGGYNDLKPRESDYTKEYIIQDLILGIEYYVTDLKFFFETKQTNSKSYQGVAQNSKYALGTYFYF